MFIMARFKESKILQGQFIAVNLSEQLIPGTYEWTLNYLIDRMDLPLFEEKYNNDEKGAASDFRARPRLHIGQDT